jgi:DNA-binding NarL/FixJ family response regulator
LTETTAAEFTSAEPSPTDFQTVAILADDLIWSTRLADAVRAAGANPVVTRRAEDLERLAPRAVIVDLTARAYDGVAAIRIAGGSGARVVAVGQHDDAALRKAALDAGASRVFTYRAVFEDGPRLLGLWLAG